MTRSEPYHHPNLRQTLLDAAVTLIGEVGPRAFTSGAKGWRIAQCTLSPLCEQGRIAGGGRCGGVRSACRFDAEEHCPGHFATRAAAGVRLRLCGVCPALAPAFPGNVRSAAGPAWGRKAPGRRANAFAVLQECIAAEQQSGNLPAGDPLPLAWIAWSLVHGIAKLATSGNLPLNARSTIEFTRSACRKVFDGLRPDRPALER
jgi:hypothetical protein